MKEIAQAGIELVLLFFFCLRTSEKPSLTVQQSCFLSKTTPQNKTKTGKLECMGLHTPFGLASLEHQLFCNAVNREKNSFRFLTMAIFYLN